MTTEHSHSKLANDSYMKDHVIKDHLQCKESKQLSYSQTIYNSLEWFI